MFDTTFGVQPEAIATAHLLGSMLDSHMTREQKDALFIKWAPWYNGRERWVSVQIKPLGGTETLIVAFGENRGSDDLNFEVYRRDTFMGPITRDEISDAERQAAYDDRKSYQYNEMTQCVTAMNHIIVDFVFRSLNKE